MSRLTTAVADAMIRNSFWKSFAFIADISFGIGFLQTLENYPVVQPKVARWAYQEIPYGGNDRGDPDCLH